ncbi:MAG: FKBP-type peptidyl-prolyl cis-trans isomerase [Anaerolineae bacterium]
MNTTREKASYCIGLETGRSLKNQFSDMDLSFLMEGFQDALSDKDPKLKNEEIQTIMTAIKRQVETQQKQLIAHIAEENKKRGDTFLAENKNKEGVLVLPSGLQYKILHEGTGPSPKSIDLVTVHYKGYFINGQTFDSSYERGKPHVFPVNRVIPGWSEALQKMKVGDKWQLFIPSYLAYGEMGFGPEIGPNVTLIFEMELLGVN